jgi:GNAT superfamily N-acetyltransferase
MRACEEAPRRNPIVRDAALDDVRAIMSIGRSTSKFTVSAAIPFYEDYELMEWITDPTHNIVMVLTVSAAVEGFLFCKLMSSHWALLDNLYICRTVANQGGGRELFDALLSRLRQLGRSYLTILTRSDRAALTRLCVRNGFTRRDDYVWMDMCL